ncbi:MAG: NAD(P)H-binding protein [Gemmatimonadetes bacterium]|nr:NAD(P)H-binding protein [Gemmatimonadota bacterium]
MQKRVLVIGSGRVAGPLIDYLLSRGHFVTIGTIEPERAIELVAGRPNGAVVDLDLDDEAALAKLMQGQDGAVSLAPFPFHIKVARACLAAGVHLVTTSYVSDEMAALHDEALAKDLLFLNECGLDPGLDHMSAMELFRAVKDAGAEVVSYKSHCGGIPAPEANDNPFGYKFSWSPKGVLVAAKSSARYCEDGKEIVRSEEEVHRHTWTIEVDDVGPLEAYPNRDSMKYEELYGLGDVPTIIRATLRYEGWSRSVAALRALGLLEEEPVLGEGETWAALTARRTGGVKGEAGAGSAREAAARHLDIPADDPVLDRLAWLGLFGSDTAGDAGKSPIDTLVNRMIDRMAYADDEPDMVVLQDEVIAKFPDGHRERFLSTLICKGEPGGESAMARTVGLPAAVATSMIVEGKIAERGVRIPTDADIYEPILTALDHAGIRFEEKREQVSD